MIEVDVALRRGRFRLNASFTAERQTVGLYGPSGAGKTTVLHALAGLLRPEHGRIRVGDAVLFDSDRSIDTPPDRRGVGMVFQDTRLFPHRTVRDNLVFGRPVPGAQGPGFDEVVFLLGLEAFLERRPAEISGGESRRVAVGRALLAKPRILVLDEPLTGLDPDRARIVLAYLLRLRRELSLPVLAVSHRYADLLALVEHVVLLDSGGVRSQGEPVALLESALGGGGGDPLCTTLAGTAESEEDGTVGVRVGELRLAAATEGAAPGEPVFVTVGARDVILAAGPVPVTSARNAIHGRVASVHRTGDAVQVALDVGPTLWAEVTEPSVRELDLRPGREVTAIIKARAARVVRFPAALA